jgi:hypothetical protein
MKILGILAVIIGFILTIFTTISVFNAGRVLDAGDLHVTKGHWYSYSWSPALGIGLIIIGGILIFAAPKVNKITMTEKEQIRG